MPCSFSKERIQQAIAFHRHSCPGLAIGIRVAEYALHHFPDTDPSDFLCIADIQMCALDAIQFFTGCSTGKGNLITRDYKKTSFHFYDRKLHKGYCFNFSPSYPDEIIKESTYLAEKKNLGQLSNEDQLRSRTIREKKRQWLMECSLEEIFTVKEKNEVIV